MCNDFDRQLSLGVDTEFCVITSSIPISPLSQGISVRRLQGQAGKKKMSIIHPVPPLLTCHIYFLGGCIDNESLRRTISAGEVVCPEGRRRITHNGRCHQEIWSLIRHRNLKSLPLWCKLKLGVHAHLRNQFIFCGFGDQRCKRNPGVTWLKVGKKWPDWLNTSGGAGAIYNNGQSHQPFASPLNAPDRFLMGSESWRKLSLSWEARGTRWENWTGAGSQLID